MGVAERVCGAAVLGCGAGESGPHRAMGTVMCPLSLSPLPMGAELQQVLWAQGAVQAQELGFSGPAGSLPARQVLWLPTGCSEPP